MLTYPERREVYNTYLLSSLYLYELYCTSEETPSVCIRAYMSMNTRPWASTNPHETAAES
jgi:hypothetical protein